MTDRREVILPNRKVTIRVKKLHPDAKLPTKATDGSACWDVYSLQDISLNYPQVTDIPTGLQFEIPRGYFLDIRPRSGLAFRYTVTIINSPGTLDSDYRGELRVGLIKHTNEKNEVKKGDRIAQIRVERIWDTEFVEVEELSDTLRGTGGFGSTGR